MYVWYGIPFLNASWFAIARSWADSRMIGGNCVFGRRGRVTADEAASVTSHLIIYNLDST